MRFSESSITLATENQTRSERSSQSEDTEKTNKSESKCVCLAVQVLIVHWRHFCFLRVVQMSKVSLKWFGALRLRLSLHSWWRFGQRFCGGRIRTEELVGQRDSHWLGDVAILDSKTLDEPLSCASGQTGFGSLNTIRTSVRVSRRIFFFSFFLQSTLNLILWTLTWTSNKNEKEWRAFMKNEFFESSSSQSVFSSS